VGDPGSVYEGQWGNLPQVEHPLLRLLDGGADVQLPLEVPGDVGAQEAAGLHSITGGVSRGEGGGWGCSLSEVHDHLHCLESVELQVTRWSVSHL